MNTSTILVVEDDKVLGEAIVDTLVISGYDVIHAKDGKDAIREIETNAVDLVVSDIHMPNMKGTELLKRIKSDKPDLPVMLMTAYGSIEQAVETMRYGAVDYMVKPFEAEVLVNMVERYIGHAGINNEDVIAEDEQTIATFNLARRVAASNATVMITGDSGSGKEVIARYIHTNSPRANKPFVAINCAAIPENMLEATLFGYEKGAFTGAYKSSPGKFEQAQGGTLLLDEISEMDLGLQAKILRVLQEKEVERLGGNKLIKLDVRILATSNQVMHEQVSEGRFREDLFYRLNVFPIHIYPLRNRKKDIIPLARRITHSVAKKNGVAIPELTIKAEQKLVSYTWPGNVRELDNVMQRALILQKQGVIDEDEIYFEQKNMDKNEFAGTKPVKAHANNDAGLPGDVREHEWEMILSTIEDNNGSRKITAKRLGISERTLRYKLAKMRDAGISIPLAS